MKIVTILGARPQFIKASSLSREIAKRNEIEEIIIHTGQHFDVNMSAIFFKEMEIPEPKYNLEINSLSHGAMTGRMLEEIEKILLLERPDWTVVYGDTNSTIAGALASKKLHMKVAHVEAGLRSYEMRMPEEINRILTDQISDILFCPTQIAVDNLRSEGFENKDSKIYMSGDIMYDSALHYKTKMKRPIGLVNESSYILVTIHRQENTDDSQRLKNIIETLNRLASDGENFLWPMHPRTKKIIEASGIPVKFNCIEPVGYLEMLYLIDNCSSIITDSGGLQKEAYFFNKFCITLRDSTEWVELVDNNVNKLMNVDDSTLYENIKSHLDNKVDSSLNLYGKGNAAEIIVNELINNS
ncbi:UDP-2,3-diacetamido-2,3-dideoxyglucuronic acid 2-epimerase [Flagellimonas maritima]|uniref:UDP-2,3-diacetamido-2,3-dideoxyglucuronic acid 2-epimerase n=1 Tax=Flagellimonas maritima TaxID=1383885 RepID=A0A2Z4LT59_9FLAO|nr:UDP-N-acetylglucosamine 2-epimerase (non-hydrolyzing) [Allomuricauda aurantiaca]AWX44538.1 UDP-2,3-diacetamido-2,3-dideoxyglucuronic acid 2-epimerase [Allomuricauda aurantiaca]